MATQKRMDQIRSILRNYLLSGKPKVTARQLKVSKNTVKEYIRRAETYSSDLSKVMELDDEALRQVMYGSDSRESDKRLNTFEAQVDYWLGELRRVGVTRELLWQEYRAVHADGYGYSQFCEHLRRHVVQRDLTLAQIDLQAARVATPKDKASVENAVTQMYRRIYAPLRQEVYHSTEALNAGMRGQLLLHNTQPYQKKSGTRQSLYEQYELPQMRPLPADLFEIKKIAHAKVQRNYHVFLGEEKNFYSVPWQYAGKQAEVLYTSRIVEVYVAQKRIATHQRLFLHGRAYRYQTREEHLPRHHQEWKKAQGYDAAYFLEQGRLIGPATQWAMQQVLLSRIHEVQAYNSCKGILQLAKKHAPERLEKAAKRCQTGGKATYNMLKRILLLHLDQEEEQSPAPLNLGLHENIRGPQYYQ